MLNDENLSTKDKLIIAAIDLISKKGYNGVTTQEIATSAGLSEKTLFRHFGSKQNLLESAYERFDYSQEITKFFNTKLVWILETDLRLISQTYHEMMNRKRNLIIISMKEEGTLPGFKERANKHTRLLMDVLTNYFTSMIKDGKVVETDPALLALTFMTMHLGAFLILEKNDYVSTISLEAFINQSIQTFTRGLTP